MSLFSTMRTSVSGMAAQSNALSAIGDNIANASTTGYKTASTEFETMIGQNATGEYVSGGVQTVVRYGISDQGNLKPTSSSTDLAINGNGFFVVSKGGQGSYLTRAGSFLPDSSGNLVNSAGYQLMGYAIGPNGAGSTLVPVTVSGSQLTSAPTTKGILAANFPSNATAVAAGLLPSTNSANATYTGKTSLTVYDNLGGAIVLDVYATKTGNNTWEVAAYQQSKAAAGGGFPYSSGPIGQTNLTFDPTTGKVTGASTLTANVPNGNAVSIDMSQSTQLTTDFSVQKAEKDGNPPSRFDHIQVGSDGTLTEVFGNGVQVPAFKIPLAMVSSPNLLNPLSGNVYQVSEGSGGMVLASAGSAGVGSLVSSQLEQSKVDLASELTNMIQAQRSYEANSKVLQTSSDLLGVLNRITSN